MVCMTDAFVTLWGPEEKGEIQKWVAFHFWNWPVLAISLPQLLYWRHNDSYRAELRSKPQLQMYNNFQNSDRKINSKDK